MDKKNLHGSIFKKLREERGYKLKDVAGDVISTRTLMRFEADETSISISIFEKLLDNLNIILLFIWIILTLKLLDLLIDYRSCCNQVLRQS